jgi:hypothetical protein
MYSLRTGPHRRMYLTSAPDEAVVKRHPSLRFLKGFLEARVQIGAADQVAILAQSASDIIGRFESQIPEAEDG